MTYTIINSVGKRVLVKDIEWDTIESLAECMEEIVKELGFKDIQDNFVAGILKKTFRIQPDKAFVEIESFIMDRDYRLTLRYGVVNFSRIEDYISYIFQYNYKEGGGDYYTIHKYQDGKSSRVPGTLQNIVDGFFEDIRLCWKQSALSVGDFL